MKSIKPGRGPSMMGGITSIAMAVFGLLWTIGAASIGGGFFALFGLVFIFIAIVQAIYNFKNATGENRYSEFDITEGNEEPDPLNEYFGAKQEDMDSAFGDFNVPDGYKKGSGDGHTSERNEFCPYCGNPVEGDFAFCNKCGKKLP